jgi:hypothetical protein
MSWVDIIAMQTCLSVLLLGAGFTTVPSSPAAGSRLQAPAVWASHIAAAPGCIRLPGTSQLLLVNLGQFADGTLTATAPGQLPLARVGAIIPAA